VPIVSAAGFVDFKRALPDLLFEGLRMSCAMAVTPQMRFLCVCSYVNPRQFWFNSLKLVH
jgi:hypothetical protein